MGPGGLKECHSLWHFRRLRAGTISGVTAHTTPPVLAEAISPARLHGEACIHCGSAEPPLVPDGHVYTESAEPGAPLGWAIVACKGCKGGRG
ncbi:hypothetical protein BX265_5017 [Streptomyces sp. TLI_235]|nr:hypothetical protein BX265_4929 [Streptomyces sp. TLI_235]PBC80179.1 hypothetical protein BX265_5017 [Streptomyces sp. TLI_235]